ncbi:DNA polymerase III subunit delta [Patescibacteria group bacterium]
MIIFLYGQDTFRSTEELKKLKARFLKKVKSSFNLIELDSEECEFDRICEELSTIPLFSELRFVILRNLLQSTSADQQKRMLEIFKREEKNRDLVICVFEKEKFKKTALSDYLKKRRQSSEFPLLRENELRRWVKKFMKENKYKADPQAIEMLLMRALNDTWWLANSLGLLHSYTCGKTITAKDVQEMTQLRVDPDIFKTIDAVAEQDAKKAICLMHQHLKNGANELYLLSMINYQFTNLVQVKELAESGMNAREITKLTKLHPFVVEKSLNQAQNFSMAKLLIIYDKLAEVDGKVKMGKMDPGVALDLLVVGLTTKSR